jgi:hypothetical protein
MRILNLFSFKNLFGSGLKTYSREQLDIILKQSDQVHSEIAEKKAVIRKTFNINP